MQDPQPFTHADAIEAVTFASQMRHHQEQAATSGPVAGRPPSVAPVVVVTGGRGAGRETVTESVQGLWE